MVNAEQLSKWCLFFISSNYQSFIKRSEFKQLKGENLAFCEENQWPPLSYLAEVQEYEKKVKARDGESPCVVMWFEGVFSNYNFAAPTKETVHRITFLQRPMFLGKFRGKYTHYLLIDPDEHWYRFMALLQCNWIDESFTKYKKRKRPVTLITIWLLAMI